MTSEFLGRGWKFPPGVDRASGQVATSEYEQDIRESIWIILSTAKGERVMRPEFGCGIHELVFDPIGTATLSLFQSSVREAIVRFEPRVELLGVEIDTSDAANGKLAIALRYRVVETNNEFNLVYPFYLTEGVS